MTATTAELLPILVSDDAGTTVYLCGVCKARWAFDSLARFCAVRDVALFGGAM